MPPRTIFLARLLGLSLVLIGLAIITHANSTVLKVTELVHNSPVILLWSMIMLIAGLALILAHNVWRGGPTTVLITIIGWITLIKALLLLFLPTTMAMQFIGSFAFAHFIVVYAVIALFFGAFLSYSGFHKSLR